MLKFSLSAAAIALLSGPALAGSLAAPVDPVVAAPVAAPAPGHDWSGLYGGLGFASLSGNTSVDYGIFVMDYDLDPGEGVSYHLGYRHDFGKAVLGLEFAAYPEDILIDGPPTDPDMGLTELYDVKLTLGYDLGRALPYVAAGYSFGTYTSDADYDVSGMMFGVGVDFALTDHVLLGVDYTYRDLEASPLGIDMDFEVSGFGLRLIYQF